MKKNIKETKQQGLNYLTSCVIFVVAVVLTALTTLALIKTDVNSEFDATFIGVRDVEATINGASYIMLNGVAHQIETIQEVKFEEASKKSSETASFTKSITVVNENDYIYYEFSITNDSTKTSYSDLIVKPNLNIFGSESEVVSSFYISDNKINYSALIDDYITIGKGDTIYLKLKEQLVSNLDAAIKGSLQLNLYTEKTVPNDYNPETIYTVEKGEVYKTIRYANGEKSENIVKMQPYEYVLVNPTTAQDVLDSDINGKTIVFDSGVYGDLLFRPTLGNVESVYEYDAITKKIGNKINDLNNLSSTKNYLYNRTLENITLVGTIDATFTGIVAVEAAHIGRDTFTRISRTGFTPKELGKTQRYDYVRNMYIEDSSYDERVVGYVANVSVDTLTIKNMTFEGKNGRVYIYGNGEGVTANFKNITVDNCSFTTNEPFYGKLQGLEDRGIGAVYVAMNANATTGTKLIENVKIIRNYSNGHYQGFYVFNTKNTKICGNASLASVHNAIAVQAGYGAATSGAVVIRGNYIQYTGVNVSTGERAIRLNVCENAEIEITDNSFTDCEEDRTSKNQGVQLLKSETLTNSSYLFANNIYWSAIYNAPNGRWLDDVSGENGTLTVYIVEPVLE